MGAINLRKGGELVGRRARSVHNMHDLPPKRQKIVSDNPTMATRPKDFSTHYCGGFFCGKRSKFSQGVRKGVRSEY